MDIEFSALNEHRAVAIQIAGRLSAEDVREMRRRTVELAEQTGYRNFIVDIRKLLSIEDGSAFVAYDLGEQFKESGFSVWNNTAVLMPKDPAAREQAELLHTVEINRGRGILSYVESIDEALSWFDDMARRD
ncbi:MAG TPA: hypothetical protein VK854_06640 [Woeseiaceae bacterium]|nr:hypothetical protein [Woeseiaceae bacterium]